MADGMSLADAIGKYGFPIIAAGGMGYLIHYIWTWVTKETKPVLGEANTTLIALIDRIRMLDNDLLRLNQKLNTVLQLRAMLEEAENARKLAILAEAEAEQVLAEPSKAEVPKPDPAKSNGKKT
jgi:hypothetical protein